ncbi:hypothetical protein O7630_11730 [Micromonospora sp. WMMD718]|uniref:hypothetical protein n=1 Tax=unclassified Micromonospora TaxID=2617518 RepID=UPI00064BB4CD|nr:MULTISPECIES: hypothetical protein [unclassified Micromonospora]MDG4751611.1 hypothetical protein [Micromonospora sp. WMMD718]
MGNDEFEELLEQSSLGSRGARQLRARVPHDQVVLTRRIADLRNQMAHGDALGTSAAAAELISYLTELGYHGQAAAVLQELLQPAIQFTSSTGDVSPGPISPNGQRGATPRNVDAARSKLTPSAETLDDGRGATPRSPGPQGPVAGGEELERPKGPHADGPPSPFSL